MGLRMSVREREGDRSPFTEKEQQRLKQMWEGAHRMVIKYKQKDEHLHELKRIGEIDGRTTAAFVLYGPFGAADNVNSTICVCAGACADILYSSHDGTF